jgi:hypothetical protein
MTSATGNSNCQSVAGCPFAMRAKRTHWRKEVA